MALVGVFVNVLLPVLLLIGLGVLLDRRLDIDVKSISKVVFYGFSPCLIFSLLVDSTVSGQDSTLIFLFVVVSTFLIGGLGWLASRAMRFDRLTTSAMLLGVMFMNSGNYGLSVNLFAFGEEGLARAALFFVASAILSNTMGVFLAARGQRQRQGGAGPRLQSSAGIRGSGGSCRQRDRAHRPCAHRQSALPPLAAPLCPACSWSWAWSCRARPSIRMCPSWAWPRCCGWQRRPWSPGC